MCVAWKRACGGSEPKTCTQGKSVRLKSTVEKKKRAEVESEPHLLHLLSPANVHNSSLFGQRFWERVYTGTTSLFLRCVVSDSG